MTDYFDLNLACTQVLEKAREADEYKEAADQGRLPAEVAADAHRETVKQGEDFLRRFSVLVESHRFQMKRMEFEHRREIQTGTEYRAGNGDVA